MIEESKKKGNGRLERSESGEHGSEDAIEVGAGKSTPPSLENIELKLISSHPYHLNPLDELLRQSLLLDVFTLQGPPDSARHDASSCCPLRSAVVPVSPAEHVYSELASSPRLAILQHRICDSTFWLWLYEDAMTHHRYLQNHRWW